MSRSCAVSDCAAVIPSRYTADYCSRSCRLLLKYALTKSAFTEHVSRAVSWSHLGALVDPSVIENANTTGKRVRKLVEDFDLDTSHFKGQGWNAGNVSTRITLDNQLGNPDAKSSVLKRLLIESGLKEAKCERPGCGLTEWFGRPAILELEHIDGNKRNNKLSNLRIYCLQCHAQTPSWRRPKSALKGVDLRPYWEIEDEPV